MKNSLLIITLFVFTSLGVNAQLTKFQYATEKMGSPFNLTFATTNQAKADEISKACFLLVDSLVHIFSDYDSLSELNNINHNAGIASVNISSRMLDLLLISQKAYHESKGTFNISVGPLSKLWRGARKLKKFPNTNEVILAKQLTSFQLVEINADKKSVYLPLKGMHLDLGGLGKGYIAQLVLDYITGQGINQAMVDAGGKIVMSNPIGLNNSWKIGINLSESKTKLLDRQLAISNCAVATSGDIYQFMYYKGKKYSHIIDPNTGYGLHSQRNVTVIAKEGAEADWLATACSILPIKAAIALVESKNGGILIAVQKKQRIKYYRSKGFERLLK